MIYKILLKLLSISLDYSFPYGSDLRRDAKNDFSNNELSSIMIPISNWVRGCNNSLP